MATNERREHEGRGGRPSRAAALERVRGAASRLGLLAAALRGEGGEPEVLADAFAEAIMEALERAQSPLVLEVMETGLHFEGHELSGADLMSRRLVDALSLEGLLRVTFFPDLSREEAVEIADLLGRDWAIQSGNTSSHMERVFHLTGFTQVHLDFVAKRVVSLADTDEASPLELVRRLAHRLSTNENLETPRILPAWFGSIRAIPLKELPALGEPSGADDVVKIAHTWQESLRATPDPGLRERLLTVGIRQIIEGSESEDVDRAIAFLRPLVSMLDPEVLGDEGARARVLHHLGSATVPLVARAIEKAGSDAAQGRVFTLGQALADGHALLRLGTTFTSTNLQQALVDGFFLSPRGKIPATELLRSASEAEAPIALRYVRRVMDPTMVVPVMARLSATDPATREAAMLALRDQRTPRIQESAISLLGDPILAVRLEALRYLTVYRVAEAASPIFERLQTSENEAEARALAMSFARIGAEGTQRSLSDLAKKGGIRGVAAMIALVALGPEGRAEVDQLARLHPELRVGAREAMSGARAHKES
jgi:hypothetical protein